MEKTIDVSPDKRVAKVTITVPYRNTNPTKEKYSTVEVIAMLEEMGYTVTDTVQAAMVSNSRPDRCTGTWIFLLKEQDSLPLSFNIQEDAAPEKVSKTIERKVKTVRKID